MPRQNLVAAPVAPGRRAGRLRHAHRHECRWPRHVIPPKARNAARHAAIDVRREAGAPGTAAGRLRHAHRRDCRWLRHVIQRKARNAARDAAINVRREGGAPGTAAGRYVSRVGATHLRSRRGEGYIVLTVLLLGFCIILTSLAIDGLGLAVTYRRAVGLASVGAQAGAGELAPFDGGRPALSGRACETALATVRASLNQPDAPGALATCRQDGNSVAVTVSLRPLKFFGGPLSLAVERVAATARAAPAFGINEQE